MKIIIFSKSKFFIEAIKLILSKRYIKFETVNEIAELENKLKKDRYEMIICDIENNEEIKFIKDLVKKLSKDTDIIVMSFNEFKKEQSKNVNFIKRPINLGKIRKNIKI